MLSSRGSSSSSAGYSSLVNDFCSGNGTLQRQQLKQCSFRARFDTAAAADGAVALEASAAETTQGIDESVPIEKRNECSCHLCSRGISSDDDEIGSEHIALRSIAHLFERAFFEREADRGVFCPAEADRKCSGHDCERRGGWIGESSLASVDDRVLDNASGLEESPLKEKYGALLVSESKKEGDELPILTPNSGVGQVEQVMKMIPEDVIRDPIGYMVKAMTSMQAHVSIAAQKHGQNVKKGEMEKKMTEKEKIIGELNEELKKRQIEKDELKGLLSLESERHIGELSDRLNESRKEEDQLKKDLEKNQKIIESLKSLVGLSERCTQAEAMVTEMNIKLEKVVSERKKAQEMYTGYYVELGDLDGAVERQKVEEDLYESHKNELEKLRRQLSDQKSESVTSEEISENSVQILES